MQRKRYSIEEKTRVALEAIKGQKTLNELAAEYGVHPSQITQWKKQALDEMPNAFSGGRARREHSEEELVASLYQEIGQLKVELDWVKKSQQAPWKRRGH
jgi:transposase-like protein